MNELVSYNRSCLENSYAFLIRFNAIKRYGMKISVWIYFWTPDEPTYRNLDFDFIVSLFLAFFFFPPPQ